MSNQQGNNSCPTNAELLAEIENLKEAVEHQQKQINSQQETIDSQQDEIAELTERLDKAEQSRGHIIEDIVEIETEVEETRSIDSPDAKGGVQAGENRENIRKFSPLGQTVSLPEHAVDSLTENQERARFIARDIQQYADMRLGELVISSGDIRKVLSAKEEKSIHWETVSRVIDFLDTMGKEDTEVKDKHGTIVCFDPESVKQWSRSTHNVVTGSKGEV